MIDGDARASTARRSLGAQIEGRTVRLPPIVMADALDAPFDRLGGTLDHTRDWIRSGHGVRRRAALGCFAPLAVTV